MTTGGNSNAREFFGLYDLDQESVQKRYNTVAAQFYRERIKQKVELGYVMRAIKEPDLLTGRSPARLECQPTKQQSLYSM
jgi:hypothetical protein